MPRPILKTPKQQETTRLSAVHTTKTAANLSELEKDRLLRRNRSKKYMELVQRLDAGGHVTNRAQVQQLLQNLQGEFTELELPGYMIGIVAKCYLGEDYQVHTLDLMGSIIRHFRRGEALPEGLEKARSLALFGGYAFIEVYTDCCCAISEDGTVSVIK